MIKTLLTNIRWSFSMRGDPSECAFLRGALPITGRRQRPRAHALEERAFYTIAEERAILLDGINSLPDRVGYLWLKTRSPEAIRMRTRDVELAGDTAVERLVRELRADPAYGRRYSRSEFDRATAASRQGAASPHDDEVSDRLKQQYKKQREGER